MSRRLKAPRPDWMTMWLWPANVDRASVGPASDTSARHKSGVGFKWVVSPQAAEFAMHGLWIHCRGWRPSPATGQGAARHRSLFKIDKLTTNKNGYTPGDVACIPQTIKTRRHLSFRKARIYCVSSSVNCEAGTYFELLKKKLQCGTENSWNLLNFKHNAWLHDTTHFFFHKIEIYCVLSSA